MNLLYINLFVSFNIILNQRKVDFFSVFIDSIKNLIFILLMTCFFLNIYFIIQHFLFKNCLFKFLID